MILCEGKAGLVGVLVYLRDKTIILINSKNGETQKLFDNRLQSVSNYRNMAYVQISNQMIVIDNAQIQFTQLQ